MEVRIKHHQIQLSACILKVFQTPTSDLYFDGSLLEKAPFVNDKIVPKPMEQHELNTAFSFLRGRLSSQPQIMISNATQVSKQNELCSYKRVRNVSP